LRNHREGLVSARDARYDVRIGTKGGILVIGYVTLGTNDFQRAAAFYDALLAELGAKRTMEMESFIAWGTGMNEPMLSIIKPFDKKPATVGNGVMVALAASSKAAVDKLHAKALSLGGKDEGAPGPRGPGFYAGYFRDLDGNKLNAFFMG
jgi:predicted lactoylglutathione lyase